MAFARMPPARETHGLPAIICRILTLHIKYPRLLASSSFPNGCWVAKWRNALHRMLVWQRTHCSQYSLLSVQYHTTFLEPMLP
eukprot:1159890-Pelagomonas_calceolata.AAC.9